MKPLLRLDLPVEIWTSKTKKFILNLNTYNTAHFRTLSAAKRRYTDHITKLVYGRRKINKRDLILEYTYFHGNLRRFDLGNPLSIINKFTEDALVYAGILPDDNKDIIKEVHFKYGGISKGNARAELRIFTSDTYWKTRCLSTT